MKIPLEDTLSDVLGKAAAGMGLNARGLARISGINEMRIQSVLDGRFESGVVTRLAEALHLHIPSLFVLATGAWYPRVPLLYGVKMFNAPYPVPGYEEMTVNSYLVWDPHSKKAAAFDTGPDVAPMLAFIEKQELKLGAVFLTHSHPDHIAGLGDLLEATGQPKVYANEREPVKGAELFKEGRFFSIGYLQVETCLTSGHSPGGTTYVLHGLDKPLAIVGDALFSCSMGGAAEAFQEALEHIRRDIFSLPDEAILCPGHGPMTTVGQEREHNPFFAEADSEED